MAEVVARESEYLEALCSLTLNPVQAEEALMLVGSLSQEEREDFVSLADSHHVIVRAMMVVEQHAARIGDADLTSWAAGVIAKEQARIDNALTWLECIVTELETAGCPTTVMKSLDHCPDLGNDLDLYSTADEHK